MKSCNMGHSCMFMPFISYVMIHFRLSLYELVAKNKTGFQLLVQMFGLYVHFVVFDVHDAQVTENEIVENEMSMIHK